MVHGVFLTMIVYLDLSSSKVIEVGANRKRVYDFLLVRNNNLGPILHRFGDFAAYMCS